jgi:hypothetical protein
VEFLVLAKTSVRGIHSIKHRVDLVARSGWDVIHSREKPAARIFPKRVAIAAIVEKDGEELGTSFGVDFTSHAFLSITVSRAVYAYVYGSRLQCYKDNR